MTQWLILSVAVWIVLLITVAGIRLAVKVWRTL